MTYLHLVTLLIRMTLNTVTHNTLTLPLYKLIIHTYVQTDV